MTNDNSIRRQRALAVAVAACFPFAADAASVARVDFSFGTITATGKDGKLRTLAKGSEIEVGDTVAVQQGRAQLRFADGALMSLQPNTEFKVDEFRFSGKKEADPDDNVAMSLFKGGMRTITGLIGKTNRKNYKMTTAVATIGIRGTEYSVTYGNSISVNCADGAIVLTNDAGTLTLTSGQSGSVTSPTSAPQQSSTPPYLPPSGGGGGSGEDPNKPNNATQDSNPAVTKEKADQQAPATATPKLTGTFTGNVAGMVVGSSVIMRGTGETITMNADGALTDFTLATVFEGPTGLGTATSTSLGNDGIIAWGRWLNGTTTGTNGDFSNKNLNGSPYGPLFYVVGLPATGMPTTGTATYDLTAFSAACLSSCAVSAVSSQLAANFGTSSISLAMQLTVTGSGAGTFMFSGSPSSLGSAGTFNFGGSMGCGGNLNAQGFLAGAGATRAGLIWNGYTGTSTVSGVNVYSKQ